MNYILAWFINDTSYIAIAVWDSKKITPQISPKNNVILLLMLIQVQYLYSNVLSYRVCVYSRFSHNSLYNSCWISSKQDTLICSNCSVETRSCIMQFAHWWIHLYTFTIIYAYMYMYMYSYIQCTIKSSIVLMIFFCELLTNTKMVASNKFSWEKLSIKCAYIMYCIYSTHYTYVAMLYHFEFERIKSQKIALICELPQIQVGNILKTCW